ncbi:MAG: hypothetical protein ABGZ17_17455 [Planctomycetaceae bacterium]
MPNGRHTPRFWIVVMAVGICSQHGRPQYHRLLADDTSVPTTVQARAALLVHQLGSARYDDRQRAVRALCDLGPPAIPALHSGAKGADLEIRIRCQRILDHLDRLDHQRILEAFVRDPTRAPGNQLAGWDRYRQQIGDTAPAQELFVEMHRQEGRLFRAWSARTLDFPLQFERRCQEIQLAYRQAAGAQRQVDVGSVASLLFFGGDGQVVIRDNTALALNNLMYYNNLKSELTQGQRKRELRALLARWLERPMPNGNYQRLLLAMRYNLKQGLVPAIKLVNQGAVGLQIQYAILAIGKLGDQSHLPVLQKQFKNTSVLSRSASGGKIVYSCQVRDVALAIAVHVTGQDTSKYGFSRLRKNSTYLYSPNSAGFKSQAARDAAFERYREWQRANTSTTTPQTATSE